MPEQDNGRLQDRDWEVLLRSIQQGNCVLLLGPHLEVTLKDGNRINLQAELKRSLREELSGPVREVESFSLVAQMFEQENSHEELIVAASSFFSKAASRQKNANDPAFQALAHIPFRVILSLRHDATLHEHLKRARREPRIEYFDFNGDHRPNLFAGASENERSLDDLGSFTKPLVYQMLGVLQPPEAANSAVLTESNLIEFLKAIISDDPGLPKDLCNHLKGKNFLFIGFGVGNFYLRILLHVLIVAQSTKSFALAGIDLIDGDGSTLEETVLFFQSTGFSKLDFIKANPHHFLQELSVRWEKRFPGTSYETSLLSQPNQRKRRLPPPGVFISYVSENEDKARRLAELLSQKGIDPWLDKDDLRIGGRWNDQLKHAIRKGVDFFVVLQSSELNHRIETWVHQEVEIALERQALRPRKHRFIFPIVLDEDAERLEVLEDSNIQSMEAYDLNSASAELAKEILREHSKLNPP